VSGITARLLSKEDIQSLLSLERIIEIAEDLFRHMAEGDVFSPPKLSLPLQDTNVPGMHWINAMPAYLKHKNTVGIKWVNVTSENRKRGLPVTMGVILLNDATTGMPTGILDGTWITHARTGASTAIGARYFARSDSKVITVVGAGAQGRMGLEATSKLFQFEEVRVVDINKNTLKEFVQSMSEKLAVRMVPFESVQEATQDSDIVLLTTTAQEPLMQSDWARPGQYVTTVSCLCDLDPKFVDMSDKFVVDDTECAINRIRMMSGVEVPPQKVYADICAVAAGHRSKRENDQEIITYAPAGMGALDVAVAWEALTLAEKLDKGRDVLLAETANPDSAT